MPADEKVQRVMTRIGVWKPEEKCLLAQPVGAPSRGYYCLNHGTYALHDIPCPDPSDPAIIVAMLNWILSHEMDCRFEYDANGIGCIIMGVVNNDERGIRDADLADEMGPTLHAALIEAIDALPQESADG